MQAAQNINAMRTGQPMGMSPAQAYQRHVADKQRMAMDRMEAERRQREANPFWEYEEAKRRGYATKPDGTDMSFQEWQQAKYRQGKAPADVSKLQQWMQLNPEATQQEIQAAYDSILRAGQTFDIGGGGVSVRNPVTGEVVNLVDPADATRREGDLAGTKTAEQLIAKNDNEFRLAASTLPEMEQALADTRALYQAIDNGEYQRTGRFEGNLFRLVDQDTARLAAKQVLQTLKNLQITNLAPVTENEIALIEDLYASVRKDPEANLGALEAAIEMMENKIALINKMGQYWVDNDGTLRDYGIQGRWQRSTPVTPPDDDDKIEMDL